jgi:hypothetical protein
VLFKYWPQKEEPTVNYCEQLIGKDMEVSVSGVLKVILRNLLEVTEKIQ